jgi:hypothetical protein
MGRKAWVLLQYDPLVQEVWDQARQVLTCTNKYTLYVLYTQQSSLCHYFNKKGFLSYF